MKGRCFRIGVCGRMMMTWLLVVVLLWGPADAMSAAPTRLRQLLASKRLSLMPCARLVSARGQRFAGAATTA